MHICFLSNEYPLWTTGGIGSFLQTYCRELVKKGHSITILGIGTEKNEVVLQDEGITLYRLPKSQMSKAAFIPNALRLRRKLRVIHKANPIEILETAELGLAFLPENTPYKKVIRLHGGHHFFAESENRGINAWKGFQEKRSFKKADAFIGVSNYVVEHTSKFLSMKERPLQVISHPINLQLFKSKRGVVVHPDLLVFAGTVCEKKGIRYLLEALPIVAKKFPLVHLNVYGRDWFYPNGDSYIERIKNSMPPSVLDRVTFKGTVKHHQLPEKYQEATLCVFPSLMETQGLVAPEAMALGKPVLFSKLGPGPETIEHMKTGLLCDPYDKLDIARKIEWALSDSQRAVQMGDQGRLFVHKKFNMETIVDENINFYKAISN